MVRISEEAVANASMLALAGVGLRVALTTAMPILFVYVAVWPPPRAFAAQYTVATFADSAVLALTLSCPLDPRGTLTTSVSAASPAAAWPFSNPVCCTRGPTAYPSANFEAI